MSHAFISYVGFVIGYLLMVLLIGLVSWFVMDTVKPYFDAGLKAISDFLARLFLSNR
jgi:hypothetical protein